jgi:hypothetical protein
MNGAVTSRVNTCDSASSSAASTWRAYSLTSDRQPSDGLISVAPKLVDSGVVSPYLVLEVKPMTWCAWAEWSKYNLRRAARTD